MTEHGPEVERWTRRVWLTALSMLLVALAFVQHPGWIAPDTKLDLTADPGGLLTRALVLWDPSAAAGQLQNQAYGYLFPMGPFFWLGDVAGLPAWLIQRLWWAVILLAGFHGARILLERLAIGTSVSRLVAAFAFALAPRMLIGLGAVSSEIWPMAMAPWVLIPLIRVAPGDERQAALRSGVAVLLIGAVNATATIAALIPAGLWILTRSAPLRWRLLGWWTVAVSLASAWWVGPLLLLGRYSPPFLDWIESASVTTAPASLPEALRGTTQWIAGITGARGPLWIAGWEVLTSRVAVGMGLFIAVVGIVGLWRAPRSWAGYARLLLVLGLILVTAGRVGPVTGLGAERLAELLDGPLTPLRNTHKFEPMVRIALTLGLAHALPQLHGWLRSVRAPWPRLAYAVVVLAIIAQTAYPALTGVSQRGRYLAVPDYWSEASDWLAANQDGGRTLVLPGSNAATSVWGDPRDEPLQALATTPWMVRDGVPLGSAATTRLLNEIEARAATGYGGEELARLFERLGVSRVLLRSDLAPGGVRPLVVRHALETAGARPVESFGPFVGGSLDPSAVVDSGMDRPLRAVEVFDLALPGTIAPDSLRAVADSIEMSGGPEGLAQLGSSDPVVFAADAGSVDAVDPPFGALTDTLARREASFAAVRDNYGRLLTADEAYSAPRRVHDWVPSWATGTSLPDVQTTKEWVGEVSAAASSSLTEPALGQPRDLSAAPESAFDGSGETAWQSAGADPVGQWVEARWSESVDLPDRLSVVTDPQDGADIAAVVVTTDGGEVRTPVSPPALVDRPDRARYEFEVEVPPGPTSRIRLTVADTRGNLPTVRVRDIGAGAVPRAESWAAMPPVSGVVDEVLMSVTADRRPSCTVMSSGVLTCSPLTARAGEQGEDLRRIFSVPADTDLSGQGTVFPRASASAEELLKRLDGVESEASSTWLPWASVSPQLVLDGDDRTYWASDPEDERPTLTVTWPGERLVTGLRLATHSDVAGRRPTAVVVSTDGGEETSSPVSEDGVVRLPPRRATSVTVMVTETTDQTTGSTSAPLPMPVVLGEVRIAGEPWRPMTAAGTRPVVMPCGFGPTVQVGGETYPTSVVGTRDRLIAGDALDLTVCEEVSVATGRSGARMIASAEFEPRSLRLSTGRAGPGRTFPIVIGDWAASRRTLTIGEPTPEPSLLVVRENANPGWRATASGQVLTSVTADGWAQGWVVPAGTVGEVRLEFTPQRSFQLALLTGLLSALVLVWLAATSRRSRARPPVSPPMPPAPRWLVAAGLVVGGALVAGPLGAGISLTALLVGRLVSRRGQGIVIAVVGTSLVVWSAAAPWPAGAATNRGGLGQGVAWLLLSVVLAVALWHGRTKQGEPSGAAPHGLQDGPLEEMPAERRDRSGDDRRGEDGDPEPERE
jgi:arabinofuranan 3-O-arabinosyltransferase